MKGSHASVCWKIKTRMLFVLFGMYAFIWRCMSPSGERSYKESQGNCSTSLRMEEPGPKVCRIIVFQTIFRDFGP